LRPRHNSVAAALCKLIHNVCDTCVVKHDGAQGVAAAMAVAITAAVAMTAAVASSSCRKGSSGSRTGTSGSSSSLVNMPAVSPMRTPMMFYGLTFAVTRHVSGAVCERLQPQADLNC